MKLNCHLLEYVEENFIQINLEEICFCFCFFVFFLHVHKEGANKFDLVSLDL